MKKNNKMTLLLALFSVGALAGTLTLENSIALNAEYDANTVWDEANELGEIDDDSYFGSCWSFTDIGSKRLDDRAVIVSDHADWGRRGQILKRKFDLTSFYIEFDCSQLASKTAVMLAFGPEGIYASENGKLISMDIVRGEYDNTAYICTLSTLSQNSGHATSIPSFTDGGTWADDANFTGVQCISNDGIIRISFHKDNDVTTTVKLNDVSTTVQNSELYENCVDSTEGYLSIGLINNAGPTQKYIIREFGDANTDVYYSEDGYFGKTKKECKEINELDVSDYNVDQILALIDRFDAIPYKKLYSYDRNWLASDYNAASEKINNLIANAGQELTLKIFENKVNAIAETYASLDEISKGLTALNTAKEAMEDVDANSLNSLQSTRFEDAKTNLTNAENNLKNAMGSAYDEAIKNYENAVNSEIDSAEAYQNCALLKSNIPTNFNEYLTEDITNDYAKRINEADKVLESKAILNYENFEQGVNAHAIATSTGIDLITAGGAYGEKSESSGLFCTQALNVLDFDVVLNFASLGEAPTGSWITFGLMENSGMWVYAETDEVQDNRGLFFLVSKLNSKTVNVQAFLCTMTSNTFYDSVLTQTISVPINQDIKVSFTSVEKTIAGVVDTYYNIDFGGTSFDQEVLKTRTLKTAFGSALKGYFFVASNGIPTSNPAIIKIGQINGKDLSSKDLAKENEVSELPPTTSTTDAMSFILGSSDTVAFNFDSKDKAITAVKVDGKALSIGDYSYENNTLTLTNDLLATLASGQHKIEASTSVGSCSWSINVSENAKKKGCGGNVNSSFALMIALLSILGLIIYSRKKIEK